MASETSDESKRILSPVGQLVKALLDQPLGLGVLFGCVLLLVGVIQGDGTVAGMLGIFGTTAVVVSAGIYAVLAVLRRDQ